MKRIYETLQSYRAASGLYYTDIDKRLGFNTGLTEVICKGEIQPTLEQIAKICVILRVSLNQVLVQIGYCKGHITEQTSKMLSLGKLVRNTDYKQAGILFGVSSQQMNAWMKYQTKLPKYLELPTDLEYEVHMPCKKKWWWFQ